jgi:hypothetical protein
MSKFSDRRQLHPRIALVVFNCFEHSHGLGDFTSLEADDGRPIRGGDFVELDAERSDDRIILGRRGSEDRRIGSGTEGAGARHEGGKISEGDRLAAYGTSHSTRIDIG